MNRLTNTLIWVITMTSCTANGADGSLASSDGTATSRRIVASGSEPVQRSCAWPSDPDTLVKEGGSVLQIWSFSDEAKYHRHLLPDDRPFLAYRNAIRKEGGEVRHPELQVPDSVPPDVRSVWNDEVHNNELVYNGSVGTLARITCLDALLFAEQNRRISQLERPTEFLASILRDEERQRLVVIFGAGEGMFPPTAVHGFDVVDEYLEDGWHYWYLLHNHTVQSGDARVVPGVPVPSTSDVRLFRALADGRELETVRVTNGFYTFIGEVGELSRLRER